MNRQVGFTLIELMVTLAILGILAALAYPAYGHYVARGHRSAAQSHMIELAQLQAQYLADSRAYASTVDDLGVTTPAAIEARYTISIKATSTPLAFTITATPLAGSPQEVEPVLTINNAGTRTPEDKW